MSTRAQILAEIAAQFPDNTTGLITPAKLRQVVGDVTNSCLVSETDAGTAGIAVLQAETPAQLRAAAGAISATDVPISPFTISGLKLALDATSPNSIAPTTYAADNFSRADSASVVGTTTVGAKTWTTNKGTVGISSKNVYASALDTSRAVATIDTGSVDTMIEGDIVAENVQVNGFALKAVDGDNFIYVALGTTSIFLRKFVAGAPSNLLTFGSLPVTVAVGSTYRVSVRCKGVAVTIALNGLYVGTFSLTGAETAVFGTSTLYGVYLTTTTARITNLSFSSPRNDLGLPINSWGNLATGWSIQSKTDESTIPVLTNGVAKGSAGAFIDASLAPPFYDFGEMTMVLVGNQVSPYETADQRVVSCAPQSYSGLAFSDGIITATRSGNAFYTGIPVPMSKTVIVYRGSVSGITAALGAGFQIQCNGYSVFRRASNNTGAQWGREPVCTMRILSGVTENFRGDLVSIYLFDRCLSDTELSGIVAWARARNSLAAPASPVRNLVFEGDSLTSSGSSAFSGPAFVSYTINSLSGATKAWDVAAHGQNIVQAAADAATQVDPLYDTSISKNVLCVWLGTNAMYGHSGSAATAFADLKAYCLARRAVGFKVVVVTCLPRSTDVNFETDRQAFNASIRADTSFYDALADAGGDATVGAPGAQNNTTYYTGDKIHMTSAGYAVVAGLAVTAINSLP